MLGNCRSATRIPVQIHIGICASRALAKDRHQQIQIP